MTTFTVQVKDSDAESKLNAIDKDNENELTKEIAKALIQVKQIEDGVIQPIYKLNF